MSAKEKDWIAQWALLASTVAPSGTRSTAAVPLERRKNRREVAEERRGRSSRTEGDLAYADFGDVHLRNPSAQCVRQQLMSQAYTEERLLSFADPCSDGRFCSDEPRILTFLPDVHRAAE